MLIDLSNFKIIDTNKYIKKLTFFLNEQAIDNKIETMFGYEATSFIENASSFILFIIILIFAMIVFIPIKIFLRRFPRFKWLND